MKAWLKADPLNFPLLYAQAIVSLVRNEEEFMLRFNAIDLMIDMTVRSTKIAAQVGAIKQMIELLLDLSIDGYRYDNIAHTLMLLINDPNIRCYFRPFVDMNKIFSIFTRPDGVDKDPKKQILDRIQAQMKLAKNAIVNMMRSW